MEKLTFKIGDTAKVKISAKDASSVYIDISGYTSMKIKIAKDLNIADNEALLFDTVLSADFSNGASGWHEWTAEPSVTTLWPEDNYLFQAQLLDGDGVITSTKIIQCSIVLNLID